MQKVLHSGKACKFNIWQLGSLLDTKLTFPFLNKGVILPLYLVCLYSEQMCVPVSDCSVRLCVCVCNIYLHTLFMFIFSLVLCLGLNAVLHTCTEHAPSAIELLIPTPEFF